MLTRKEKEEVLQIAQEYIKSVMEKYAPSDIVLADFEETEMSKMKGYEAVNQTLIRRLILCIKKAFSAQRETVVSAMPRYSTGQICIDIVSDNLYVYDMMGNILMSFSVGSSSVLSDLNISRGLTLSQESKNSITNSIELTEQDLEDIWSSSNS